MAIIRLQLARINDTPFSGSARLVPKNVEVSGSKIYTLDWLESDTEFVFEDVVSGLYEITASSPLKVSPLFCINVPSGSGDYNALDLEFPPTERSLTWVPNSALSASWASSSISASYVKTAQTASYVLGSNVKGTVATASYALKSADAEKLNGQAGPFYQDASNLTSGSLPVGRLSGTYFITASQAQSASYAVLSTSGSYAVTASYVKTAQTASYVQSTAIDGTVSTASFAHTASVALNGPAIPSGSLLSVTASHALTASFALNVLPTVSASWASASLSASYAFSASYAPQWAIASGSAWQITSSVANSASVALNALTASSAVSASFAPSASYSQTASYALNAQPSVSSSYASSSLSSSYSLSASYAPQWSIVSGSTLNITSSVALTASFVTLAQSASFVTASNIRGTVTSASVALSASWAPFTAVTSVPSASWASSSLSASYAPYTFSLTTGSSYPITASWSGNAVTASHALKLVDNASLTGSRLSGPKLEGTISIDSNNIVPDRVPYVNSGGVFQTGTATSSDLGFISGLSSSAQVQLDAKQPRIGTGSFLPITSSQSISASYAPHNPVVDGIFTVTTASNVATIALIGRGLGGQTLYISSTPAGFTVGNTTYVAGDVHANEFIGLVQTASYANTSSVALVAHTASYLRDSVTISGSVLKWHETYLSANGPNGISIYDDYTGNDVLWTYDDTINLRNVAVVDTTPGKVVVTNAEGRLTTGIITSGDIANLSGSTSNIQAQINGKQAQLITGSVYPITASFALSASWFISSSTAATASLAVTASHAVTAASAVSASYSLSSSYGLSGSYALTSSYAVSASYVSSSHSSSFATSASYAITASNLNGFLYDTASFILPVSQSNLIVIQRVTGSLSSATFTYTARSGSAIAKGIVEAEWLAGDSGSLQWQHDRARAGRRISIDEAGTKTETIYFSDLYMNAVLGGNSIQLRASASTAPWHITASAVYF